MAERKKAAKAAESAQEPATEAQEAAKAAESAQEPATEAQEAAKAAESAQEPATEAQEAPEAHLMATNARYRVTYPYGLNLREGPGKDHAVLRVLRKGAVVQATGLIEEGLDGVWMQTAEGWVNGAYLAPEGR